jgi:polyphosphate kinase
MPVEAITPAIEKASNGAVARRPSAAPGEHNLEDPSLYLNRELTWLAFNRRVLHEAEDERNPLLERLKFLAIAAWTIDDFFMKRIGGLKQRVAAGATEPTVDGLTPQQQIVACYARIRQLEREQRRVLASLLPLLAEHDIRLLTWRELTDDQRAGLREHYIKNVFPLLTPLALDPAHPFPFVSNLSLNLLVSGRSPDDEESVLARVKVPVGLGIQRFLQVGDRPHFVPLEEVMANTLDLLFPGLNVTSCELFRVTRNANTERDEDEADDLLELIESELRDRRFAPIVRLEVARGMDAGHRGMLAAELGLSDSTDVFEVDGILALNDLMQVASVDEPALHDPPLHPADPPRLPPARNIFHAIRDVGTVMVLHPYESFASSTERFLREASQDPKVRAIKMTLYRTSSDARIPGYLIDAARNGKQVAVVVELKARFDEAANIAFAGQLEEAGIHVSYGVVGLKTHCKVVLVVREDYDGLRRYVHIGTGNYHPGTARLYADIGMLSTDTGLSHDVTELFNYLTTGYGPGRGYKKLLVGPARLKPALLERIEREIRHGREGLIQFKMNALEDADITRALYRAAQAGVRVELVVRDTCRLAPGIAGLSESARVVSIVGRFLEHARIYYFRNRGADEYFIGSADCMKRNLESRVEVLAPVEDQRARQELRTMLDLQLAPNRDAWTMLPDGAYVKEQVDGPDRGSQFALLQLVQQRRLEEPAPHRRRFARRPRRAAVATAAS